MEQVKIIEILKDNNNNLKITYDIKLSHCGATWWIEDLTAYYDNYFKMINRVERPTRTKQNKIIDLLLNELLERGVINE